MCTSMQYASVLAGEGCFERTSPCRPAGDKEVPAYQQKIYIYIYKRPFFLIYLPMTGE